MKSIIAVFGLLVFSSIQAQNIYQEDISPFLHKKHGFAVTLVKDKLIKSGITLKHSFTEYDELEHRDFISENSFNQSMVDIESSSATKNFSKIKIESKNVKRGFNNAQTAIGAVLGAIGGYYVNESACNYRNEVDARVERLRNK